MRHPLLHDLIEAATPLGPVYGHQSSGQRWRRYDKLRRWPDQFLVVGDALATFDPAHGQGMTAAVQSALVLEHLLISHGTAIGISYRLRRALAHRLAPAWELSTRSLRATGGGQTPSNGLRARLTRAYARRAAAAATTDPYAAALLLEKLQAETAPTMALRLRTLPALLRTPSTSANTQPPSATHGPQARRRPGASRRASAVGVSIGSAASRSTGHGSAAATPTGNRRQP